ncbi:MAG: autotransporter-associated beta strand repeat-containing protein [Thermoguttaceae bacterium]|nr:autotransporter-associated beta strand repeat-containing protein [Thermoguttaceae bacterium]
MLAIMLAGSVTLATTYTDNTMPSGNITTTTDDPVEFDISNSATYSDVISGAGTVTKNGDGTLTLSNYDSSFTGDVYINSGTVLVTPQTYYSFIYAYNSCLGRKIAGRTIYINSGATLSLGNQDNFSTGGDDLPIVFVCDGGAINNPGTIDIYEYNGKTRAYNFLQHTIFKNGATLHAVTGNESYKAYKLHDVKIVRNDDNSPAAPVTFTSDLTKVNATICFGDRGGVISAGTSESTVNVGEITSADSSVNDGVSDLVISAIVANPTEGVSKVIKAGAGTMELTAANTYTGPMTVSAGTLKFTDNAVVANGTVTVEDGATVEYNVSNGTTKLLTVASANQISGNGELVKTGDGTLQIYTESAGLVQAESFVVSSGRLDMQEFFSGTLTVEDDAQFSPGISIGSLEINGDFDLAQYATLLMEIGGTDKDANDILTVSGSVTYDPGAIVSFEVDSNSEYIPSIYDIVAVEMPEVDWDIVTFSSSKFYPIRYENGIQYLGVVVPEPSTWAMLILGVVGLMYWRKNAQKRA